MAEDLNNEKKEELPEVEQELSQVATNPKQSMLILAVIVAIFGYLVFNLFLSSEGNTKKQEDTPIPDQVSKPTQAIQEEDIPTIPTLPTPPKLEAPVTNEVVNNTEDTQALPTLSPTEEKKPTNAPPEIALPVDANDTTVTLPVAPVQDEKTKTRKEAKIKSNMILINNTPAKTPEQIQQDKDFTFTNNTSLLLGRGKMISAILETAINSDFSGPVRAIISRDVFSEQGRNLLIPKGSRIFGTVGAINGNGYGMVAIVWSQINLTNGYRINLGTSGIGTDSLGRLGIQGRVDNKFKEQFTNAVLKSAFDIVAANTIDAIVPPVINSQAATQQTNLAANVRNIANGIFTQAGLTDVQKRTQICTSTVQSIQDTTSSIYTQIQSTCNDLNTNTTATDAEKLQSLMATINSLSDQTIQDTAQNVEPSNAQVAAENALKNITKLVEEMITKQAFSPSTTLDQGTPVKIYIDKDFVFPPRAVGKFRVIK